MTIANAGIARLFTVPSDSWNAIHARVGVMQYMNTSDPHFVIAASDWNAAAAISNATMNGPDGPDYLDFLLRQPGFGECLVFSHNDTALPTSNAWVASTYPGLLALASQVQQYGKTALTEFTPFVNQLEKGAAVDTAALSVSLAGLNARTLTLQSQVAAEFQSVRGFLQAQQSLQQFMDANQPLLRLLSAPPLDGSAFEQFSTAVEQVLGVWASLQSALSAASVPPAQMTLEFIQGLRLSAALAEWTQIVADTSAFLATASPRPAAWTWQPAQL